MKSFVYSSVFVGHSNVPSKIAFASGPSLDRPIGIEVAHVKMGIHVL